MPGVVPDPEAVSDPQPGRAGRRHEELARGRPPHVRRVGRVELGDLLPILARLAPDLHVAPEVAEAAQQQEVALKQKQGYFLKPYPSDWPALPYSISSLLDFRLTL